jgi:hypothetical protein
MSPVSNETLNRRILSWGTNRPPADVSTHGYINNISATNYEKITFTFRLLSFYYKKSQNCK